MKICPGCDRHLFGPEPACPFCGAAQQTASATGLAASCRSAATSVALVLSLGAVACGPPIELETAADSSSSADGTGPAPTTTAGPTSTVGPATAGPATDDGPAMTTIEETSIHLDSDDDAGCAFYAGCPPDVGESPFECDPFAQDCPPGEKCVGWANDGGTWNATRCSPVANDPGQEGDPCTVEGSNTSGLDDCDLGLMCFHVDVETNQGTCVSLCQGTSEDPTCSSREQLCSISHDGALTLCLDACDPLMQACDEGQACYPTYDYELFVCTSTSAPTEYGGDCESFDACAPGLVCLGSSAVPDCPGLTGCCTSYCDTTAPNTCPDADLGVICVPWYRDPPPPGFEDLGVCVLPQ